MGNGQSCLPGFDAPKKSDVGHHAIAAVAASLAVKYAEEHDIPARYRPGSNTRKRRKPSKRDLLIEERFRGHLQGWHVVVERMCERVDPERAWRFLQCTPEIGPDVRQLTDCEDFQAFLDYFIERRDAEVCGADELGRLSALNQTFQQAIERQLAGE